jgi:S-adenosylmethionine/arginine decarboxylase-like enzyme
MVRGQTRKRNRNNANTRKKKIEHHHLLLRLELGSCPGKEDKEKVGHMIQQIISDIGMKSLAAPHVYYMTYPRFNEGLTGIAPIETSHIAFHFWTRPDPKILHTSDSNCLLEFDIYTCSSLTIKDVGKVLHHLTQYKPSYADITILNRSRGLAIERHMHWNSEESTKTWANWINGHPFA